MTFFTKKSWHIITNYDSPYMNPHSLYFTQCPKYGCKAFGQLEFWHRALSAYGILSVGILAYGILSILLLAYSILAMHLDWHSPIIITAWTFN